MDACCKLSDSGKGYVYKLVLCAFLGGPKWIRYIFVYIYSFYLQHYLQHACATVICATDALPRVAQPNKGPLGDAIVHRRHNKGSSLSEQLEEKQ